MAMQLCKQSPETCNPVNVCLKGIITRLIAAHHIKRAKRIIDQRKAQGRKYIRKVLGHV